MSSRHRRSGIVHRIRHFYNSTQILWFLLTVTVIIILVQELS